MARNIQREFVKYYKERLASLGFIKVKGRQPYFVRVINDEILHILTLDTGMSAKDGYKVAHLECGVATVYRQEINLSVTPRHNSDWLVDYTRYYTFDDGTEFDYTDSDNPVNHVITADSND